MNRDSKAAKAGDQDGGDKNAKADPKQKSPKNVSRVLREIDEVLNFMCVEHWAFSGIFITVGLGCVALGIQAAFPRATATEWFVCGGLAFAAYGLIATGYVLLRKRRPPATPVAQSQAAPELPTNPAVSSATAPKPLRIGPTNPGRTFVVCHTQVGNWYRDRTFTEYDFRQAHAVGNPPVGEEDVAAWADVQHAKNIGRLLSIGAIRVVG